jgi:hypothetical protein
MTTVTIAEKRKHPRFPLGIAMDIRAKGQTVGKCRGTIADLSASGMTLQTDALLDEGMTLHLKLGRPNPIEIRGEIRHSKGSAAGGMKRYGVRLHKIGAVAA